MKCSILAGGGVLAAAVAFGLGVVTAHATDHDPTRPVAPDTSVGPGGHAALPVIDFALPTTGEQKIADALAALPTELRAGARVVDYPAKATDPYPELRPGSNDWTCFPDLAASKGDDPICFNRPAMRWQDAYVAGSNPPPSTELGVIYRLRGGSDASLTDVYAVEPAPGHDWILYGPHMVIVPTTGMDTANLPTVPGEHPWVMNRGTPWVHIHLPVQ